jgi:hypothetical protein
MCESKALILLMGKDDPGAGRHPNPAPNDTGFPGARRMLDPGCSPSASDPRLNGLRLIQKAGDPPTAAIFFTRAVHLILAAALEFSLRPPISLKLCTSSMSGQLRASNSHKA